MQMRTPLLMATLALAGTALTGCCSQCQEPESDTATTVMADTTIEESAAINNICPVGREAITAESPTTTYKGLKVAFCCDSCSAAFMEWDESARDRWLVAAQRNPDYVP